MCVCVCVCLCMFAVLLWMLCMPLDAVRCGILCFAVGNTPRSTPSSGVFPWLGSGRA